MAEAIVPVLDLDVELAVVTELAADIELERKTVLLGSADEVVWRMLPELEELVVPPKSPEDQSEEETSVGEDTG